jgi:hypothetical protein
MGEIQTPLIKGTKFLRGPAMLIIWGGASQTIANEDELNDWWTNEHLPERLRITGFLRTRRFYSLRDGLSQYLVWYEVNSLDVLTSKQYMEALNNPTAGTKKFMPILAAMNRSACRVLHSVSRAEFSDTNNGGIGGTMAHIVFKPPFGDEEKEELQEWVANEAWPTILKHPAALAMHLIEHDDSASKSGSSTKSYDAVRFSKPADEPLERWMVLVEYAEPMAMPFARHSSLTRTLAEDIQMRGGQDLDTNIYSLICTMSE